MRRHLRTRLCRNRILAPPQTRHGLRLRVEIDPRLAVERIDPAAGNRFLVACEGEHWEGYWHEVSVYLARTWYKVRTDKGPEHTRNRHIHPHLPSLDIPLEPRRRAPTPRKDRDAIPVLVCVDEVDGVVDSGDVDAHEDGAEDLFGVAAHVGFYVCDDCGANLQMGGGF